MRIGVPTEIKNHEYRVGLTPSSVRELRARGHDVLVQSGAGAQIGPGATLIFEIELLSVGQSPHGKPQSKATTTGK